MLRTPHLFILCALSALSACFEPDGVTQGELVVAITDARGAPVSEFVAVIDTGNAHPLRVVCPGAHADSAPRCASPGLRGVPVPVSGALSITVKARPYRFATVDFDVASLRQQGARVTLGDRAPPELTPDYATGFDPGGLAAFERLAYTQRTEAGPSEVVKFYIDDLAGDPTVYFQNTRTTPLHYDFVTRVLGRAISRADFEAHTYHGMDRDGMAGSLVYYPDAQASGLVSPIALTFFPSDDLTVRQARTAALLIEEALGFAPMDGGERRLVYVPAGEQQEHALAAAARDFEQTDSRWLNARALFDGPLQVLNPGLAFGTLRILTPEQLATTPVSFRDVLVLTRLPNELPIVAGTISDERQTPLAHVNVAARSRGTPNISLAAASRAPQIVRLAGKLVRFEAKDGAYSLREATLSEAEEHWAKHRPARQVPVFDLSRQGLPSFAELGFEDAIAVGAKAANLAELRALLGDGAPEGFAVPFYYFDQHMERSLVTRAGCTSARADCTSEGRGEVLCDRAFALCEASSVASDNLWFYARRLGEDAQVNAETELREACFDGLQFLIRHAPVEPTFAQALDRRVAELFGTHKVKLRSSTNAEDLPGFSGAGLYESQGAYASGDKAASLRIGDIYASVFAFRAVEERTYWNIDHAAMRMGIAVNRAIGDEQVNGVLLTQNVADSAVAGMYVNLQKGEVSVTNPEDGSLPEALSIVPSPTGGVQAQHLRDSSLSPGVPLLSNAELRALYLAARAVQEHFAPLYHVDPTVLILDIEFKFYGPQRRLLFKQVRPYGATATAQGKAIR